MGLNDSTVMISEPCWFFKHAGCQQSDENMNRNDCVVKGEIQNGYESMHNQWKLNIRHNFMWGVKSSNAIGSLCLETATKSWKIVRIDTNWCQSKQKAIENPKTETSNKHQRRNDFCKSHSQCLWSFIRCVDGQRWTMGDRSFWFFERWEQCNDDKSENIRGNSMAFLGKKLIRTQQRRRTLCTCEQLHISPTFSSSWHKMLVDTCKTSCQTWQLHAQRTLRRNGRFWTWFRRFFFRASRGNDDDRTA